MNHTGHAYISSPSLVEISSSSGSKNSNTHIEEFIDRHLVCTGCKKHFQTSVYTPTLLPCLHSICPPCLKAAQSTLDGEILTVCPSCKQQVPSKEGVLDTESICPDFHTDFLAEYLGYTGGIIKLCEGCEALTKVAVAGCSNCMRFLCKECLIRHQYSVGYSHQHFKGVDDLTPEEWAVFERQQHFCVIHQTQALTLYCSSDNCQTPVCLSCCEKSHSSEEHNISDLGSIVEQLKAELTELLIMSEKQTRLLEKLLENIDVVTSKLTCNAEEATHQIKALFTRCHKVLQQREDNLLHAVTEAHSQMQQRLKRQKDDATTMLANIAIMSDCTNDTNGNINVSSKVSVSRVQKKLEGFFKEVADGTFYPLPLANSCIDFSYKHNEAITYFDSAVKEMGKVIEGKEVPFLTLVHAQESFIHQENIVDLEMTNLEGDRCTEGGAMVVANITSPSGQSIDTTIVDNMDGSYAIRYFPSEPGDHFLYVEVSHEPITEKPIKVPVYSLCTNIKGENTDEECMVEIYASDVNGKRQTLSNDLKFKANILDPQQENLKPQIYYYPYGYHGVAFRPKSIGEHSVMISLNDVALKCSPVKVPIHRIISCQVDRKPFFLENISGMTVTNMGKIFLADTIQNERVLGFTGHGECFTKIKTPYKGDALITKDRKDNLALLFPYRQVMIFYTQKGKQIRFFDTPQVVNPVSIAITSADETLVLECLSSSILVYNSAGVLQTTVGGTSHTLTLGYPVSMSLDSRDNIYISNKTGGAILNLTWKGELKRTIKLPDAFNQVGSVDCTPDGYLLIHEEKLAQMVYVVSRSSGNVLLTVEVHGIVGFLEHLGVTPDGCFVKLDRKSGCLRKYRYAYYGSKTRKGSHLPVSSVGENDFEVVG